jgi:peptidoglycan/LPS O-acetylase OafA/YrhL
MQNSTTNSTRINVLDGWRSIACLGVLFTHVLGTLNMPQLNILGIDIFKLFNLWGSGVHLFFDSNKFFKL